MAHRCIPGAAHRATLEHRAAMVRRSSVSGGPVDGVGHASATRATLRAYYAAEREGTPDGPDPSTHWPDGSPIVDDDTYSDERN